MKTTKIVIGLLSIATLAGCKDKMVELNTNPDTIMSASVPQLFVASVNGFGYNGRSAIIDKASGVMSLMQYLSSYTSNLTANPFLNLRSPGGSAPGSWGIQYNQFFGGQGKNLANLIRTIDQMDPTTKEMHMDARAICEIITVYQQWNVVSNYGAIVYDEAFKAITDGITEPKYQKIQEIWKDLDKRLKAAIEILAKPAIKGTVELGKSDFFNGWKMNTAGSPVPSEYAEERANWLKFGNVFRLEMAWMLAKVEPANFETVKTEVMAVPEGLMTKMSEGTYFYYSATTDNNPDDVDQMSKFYAASETFVNYLKANDDARLPLLARPNGLAPEMSPNFKAMQMYFPDSLAKYGNMMTGKNIFIGSSSNPRWKQRDIWSDANFPGSVMKTFNKLINPAYPDSLAVDINGSKYVVCEKGKKEFNITLNITSPSQARYYIKCGGKEGKNGPDVISDNVNLYRFDGKGGDWTGLSLRRNVYTYPQQCFFFAVAGITAGGKSPAQWYAEGVKAAMEELLFDATRLKVRATVNGGLPQIPGTRLETIPYTYDAAAEATAIIGRVPYSAENAMAQAWVYFYNQPEQAYMWWLRTGLIPLVSHSTPLAAAAETRAYLEAPFDSQSEALGFPRRACLPNQNAINVNFGTIKIALEAEPGFGQWENTAGRIWWDKE